MCDWLGSVCIFRPIIRAQKLFPRMRRLLNSVFDYSVETVKRSRLICIFVVVDQFENIKSFIYNVGSIIDQKLYKLNMYSSTAPCLFGAVVCNNYRTLLLLHDQHFVHCRTKKAKSYYKTKNFWRISWLWVPYRYNPYPTKNHHYPNQEDPTNLAYSILIQFQDLYSFLGLLSIWAWIRFWFT